MSGLGTQRAELGRLDRLAAQDTAVHRMDPRLKFILCLVYILCVVSFGKYEVSAMLPFFFVLLLVMSAGHIPPGFLFRRMLPVLPFAVCVGIFNPFFDREPMVYMGAFSISGGWISFCSILLRFVLCAGAALLLLAVTGINNVCYALGKLGTPTVFTVQLLFLYRYLFLLMDEGIQLVRARASRSFGGGGLSMPMFSGLIGQLFIRSIDRAHRIHSAMQSRGFAGTVHVMREVQSRPVEWIAALVLILLFVVMRMYNLPRLMGMLITGEAV